MKRIISIILKIILHKEIYNNRRNNPLFISYSKFEFFIKTLKLRIKNPKYFFMPSRHIGAIYLLEKLTITFKNEDKEFFLWDSSLLGAVRNQKAIAGSAGDIDIAMIFNKKKDLNFILSLKGFKKIRALNNYNSIQLYHDFGLIDLHLFIKKNNYFHLNVIKSIKDKGPKGRLELENLLIQSLSNKKYDHSITENFVYPKNYFFPLKKKELYKKKYSVPNKYLFIVKGIYGSKWKIPDKKEQVYFI
tara:strand:+ start:90 stop:827 length:738 start_codon:yes stop_codon:yes gene_type:complete